MKKFIIYVVLVALLSGSSFAVEMVPQDAITIAVPSAVLMEKASGMLIYEKNSHERLPPASVTKIMTLLLVMEEISKQSLAMEAMVSCSSYAAGMGGSQIWLEEGEQMSVHDMLKAVCVVSANDCAVALAEHIAGSEEAFVAKMNARAAELGMVDTNFCDCTGLTESAEHFTTAYDIALMSRELISHQSIKEFSTIWMDTLRDGKSGLTNTNKLIRFYKGATGLKTGFTNRAMYCLSATAQRDGTELIAVVMHGETSDTRFESAKVLLNYGFANYANCPLRSPEPLPPVPVTLGMAGSVQPIYDGPEGLLVEKATLRDLRYETLLPESVEAPVASGQKLGELVVYSGDKEMARVDLLASAEIERLNVWQLYGKMVRRLFAG